VHDAHPPHTPPMAATSTKGHLPLARVGIVLLGLIPALVLAIVHPAPTLTESLADASSFGVAIVALFYAGSALLELLALHRVEGILGAAIYAVVVFTALNYAVCDWMCVTHRSAVVVLFVVEACLLFTRGYGWLVLLGGVGIVVAILALWNQSNDNGVDDQTAWIGALELLALASVRLLAAQVPVNADRGAWAALLARPRRLLDAWLGEDDFEA